MAKLGASLLQPQAQEQLISIGYKLSWKTLPDYKSRNVQCIEKDGKEEFALIQCRSHDSENSRYLVGIIVEALNSVNSVVLYFQGETTLFKIPAQFLIEIHEERIKIGDARYTEKQWRVDFTVFNKKMSPQGSNGVWYDVSPYAIKIKQSN